MKTAYAKAGVDIHQADLFTDWIAKTVKTRLGSRQQSKVSGGGGYAGLYALDDDQILAATTDGVGTKLKLAFALGNHKTVGIDLVAMSVNDLVCVGARPLLFLDYLATGKLDLQTSKDVMLGIIEGCRQGHLALVGGETAEMPGMYQPGEYDLAGFAVGILNKKDLLNGPRVRPGDVLIAIESSGPHSNGYSLIRKLIGSDRTLQKRFLKPTHIYVDVVCALQKQLKRKLHGLAHVTGSGFLNIPRLNENLNYDIEFAPNHVFPESFTWLGRKGKLSWSECFTTFNMGVGMVAAVQKEAVDSAIAVVQKAGLNAFCLGVVRRPEGRRGGEVSIRGSMRSAGARFHIVLS